MVSQRPWNNDQNVTRRKPLFISKWPITQPDLQLKRVLIGVFSLVLQCLFWFLVCFLHLGLRVEWVGLICGWRWHIFLCLGGGWCYRHFFFVLFKFWRENQKQMTSASFRWLRHKGWEFCAALLKEWFMNNTYFLLKHKGNIVLHLKIQELQTKITRWTASGNQVQQSVLNLRPRVKAGTNTSLALRRVAKASK